MFEKVKEWLQSRQARVAGVLVAVAAILTAILWAYRGEPVVIEDALKIDAPSKVEIGELVSFKVRGASSPCIRVLAARPGPDDLATAGGTTQPVLRLSSSNAFMLMVTRQGTYVIEAYAASGRAILAGRAVVTIGEPGPDPTPTPDVKVTPGKRTVAIIRETADSNPELAGLAVKLRTNKDIETKGHQVYILDKDMLPTAAKVNARIAAIHNKLQSDESLSHQLPLLFILDQDSSSVYFAGSCPKDEKGVLDLIRRYGG